MKTRKNLWATLFLATIWTIAVILVIDARAVGLGVGLPQLIVFCTALFLTYQLLRLLEYVPEVLHKQPSRQRIDRVLNNLSEDDLAALRQRPLDTDEGFDYQSFDALLQDVPPKRKARNA